MQSEKDIDKYPRLSDSDAKQESESRTSSRRLGKQSRKRESRSRSHSKQRNRGPNKVDERSRKLLGSGYFRASVSPSLDDKKKKSSNKKSKLIVPQLDGPMIRFREFMENQTDRVDKEVAESHYAKYKQDWEAKQNEIFFQEHKDEAWFQEKYDPYKQFKLNEERTLETQGLAEQFFQNVKNGVYDSINLEIDEEVLSQLLLKRIKYDGKDTVNEYEEENPRQYPFQEVQLNDDFDITQSPFFGFDGNMNTLFIKTIPKKISRWDIKNTIEELPGFQHFSISEPQKIQEYSRYGWIQFKDETSFNQAATILDNFMVKDFAFSIVKSQHLRRAIRIAPKIQKGKIKNDIESVKKLIEAFDTERSIENNPLFSKIVDFPEQKKLDLLLLYLRRVHSYCYYSCQQFNDERMLSAKCGCIFLRMKNEEENDFAISVPNLQNKAQENAKLKTEEVERKEFLRLKPEKVEQQVQELTKQKLTQKALKQVKKEENIWPCSFCEKKFKGDHYLIKHIENKHETELHEEKKKSLEQLTLENYANDKFKITEYPQNNNNNNFQSNNNRNKRNYKNYNQNNSNWRNNQRNYNKRGNNDRKQNYKDYDDPEVYKEETQSIAKKNIINYHNI